MLLTEAVGITDASAEIIGRFRDLESTQVTDAGLAELAGLTNLRRLRIHGERATPVTDAGIIHLRNMSKLEYLSISGEITDASVPLLVCFRKLRGLDVFHTEISDPGERQLRTLLPECGISYDESKYTWRPPLEE